MNRYFSEIKGSDWLTSPIRQDFARYIGAYSESIEPCFGSFNWQDDTFHYFCKKNSITAKGNKNKKNQLNHIWFSAGKPEGNVENDIAFHYFRHIRNAFAHGNVSVKIIGKKKNKYLCLEDWDKKKGVLIQTMSGVIRIDLFWEMIWLLYQTRK